MAELLEIRLVEAAGGLQTPRPPSYAPPPAPAYAPPSASQAAAWKASPAYQQAIMQTYAGAPKPAEMQPAAPPVPAPTPPAAPPAPAPVPPPAPRAWTPDDGARQELLRRQMEEREKDRLKQTNARLAEMGERGVGVGTISERATDAMKVYRDAAEQHGAGLAALDPGTAAGAGKQATVAAAGGIGSMIGGAAVGGPAGMAVDLVLTRLVKFGEGFSAAADRFAEVNGEIGQAKAQAEMMQVLGDIKRANYAATEFAEMTQAQAELSQAAQDAMLKLMKPLIPIVTGFMQFVTWALESLVGKISDESQGGDFLERFHEKMQEQLLRFLDRGAGRFDPNNAPPLGRPRNPLT